MAYTLEALATDIRTTLKSGPISATGPKVVAFVEKALKDKEFVQVNLGKPGMKTREIIFEDPETGFCVCAHTYEGAATSAAHDHGPSWAIYGQAIGVTEMTYVLATGELWFQVPPTVRVELTGAGGPGLMAKDLVLAIGGRHGTDVAQYAAIEFHGPRAAAMTIAGRMTMANMGAELGAKFAMFPADAVTAAYLAERGVDALSFGPEHGAVYDRTVTLDTTDLEPQVARPHNPGNVAGISAVAGTPVHQAFLGSCTNARLEDLAVAAEILRGRRVHPRVRLLVTPASQQVFLDTVRAGHVAVLAEAGAHITASGCGACPGGHQGLLGPGERCISSTNRNFLGRMGSQEAEVYLGSPAVVAAAAVAGELIDPRHLWTGSTL